MKQRLQAVLEGISVWGYNISRVKGEENNADILGTPWRDCFKLSEMLLRFYGCFFKLKWNKAGRITAQFLFHHGF